MTALLNSLSFTFTNSSLPKYRVKYYDYIMKWCSAGLYSNASAFALVSANAAFAFALAFDCPEVGAFAFALAFESKTFAFDSNAFDWIQMPFKCQSNAT